MEFVSTSLATALDAPRRHNVIKVWFFLGLISISLSSNCDLKCFLCLTGASQSLSLNSCRSAQATEGALSV